jgi:VWFA-related protein
MKCALSLVFAFTLSAQFPRYDVQSRLVQVPVTVTDAHGRSIDGLEAPDFVLLDEGRPQKASVDTFATGVAPIALVVAVQSSGISAAVLDKVHKIGAMIQPLITGERGCAAVVSFAERVEWRQECTADQDALTRAFEGLTPGEELRGCMLDAVHEAIDHLAKRPNARRVLLLISESRDRGSENDLDEVLVDARVAGVTVYAATYSALKTGFTSKSSKVNTTKPQKQPASLSEQRGTLPGFDNVKVPPPNERLDILGGIRELNRLSMAKTTEALTSGTGGVAFPFTRQKGLEDAIEKLGAELHSQYVLSFIPEGPAPAFGYHHLEVRVGGVSGAIVRARPGYWSVAQ